MLKFFKCPNGNIVDIGACLSENGCYNRCKSLSTLTMCADSRNWTGKPSCTQLINGTRLEYLKIINDYSIDPDDSMFAILGTKAHLNLEKQNTNVLIEKEVEHLGITGIIDEIDIINGKHILIDHKTSGSYKIKQYLEGNYLDWQLQLNFYRIAYEKQTGNKISELKVEMIPRDGNTWYSRKMGIDKNCYFLSMPILEDIEVEDYFEIKKDQLLNALENKEMPAPCTEDENWGGNRCKSYCPVKDLCDYGRDL